MKRIILNKDIVNTVIILIILWVSPSYSNSTMGVTPLWRTTWGDARYFHSVHAMYPQFEKGKKNILAVTNQNILKLDTNGKIIKNLQLVNNNLSLSCTKELSNGKLIMLYSCKTKGKCSNLLIIVDPDSFSIQKIIPLKTPYENLKITEDKKNKRFILAGRSKDSAADNKSLTLQIFDINFNLIKTFNERQLNLDMPLQSPSDIFFDDEDNAVILLASSTHDNQNYVDSIVILDENLLLKRQVQLKRPSSDNTASGYRYIKGQATEKNYVILVTSEKKGGGCCKESLFLLNKKLYLEKELDLLGSARYGSQLEKTDSDTFLITAESIGGRGYLCEIDSNNNTISHWTSNAEKSWSTATAALKLDDGYIVALESAYSKKHEKAGTRGVIFIRLKFNNFLKNNNRKALIKYPSQTIITSNTE